jgi:hypothetical protein
MSSEEHRPSAFSRSFLDTCALVFLGTACFLPELAVVGLVLLWVSDFWSQREKWITSVVTFVLIAAWLVLGATENPPNGAILLPRIGFVVCSFTLAFRMGLRDSPSRVAESD